MLRDFRAMSARAEGCARLVLVAIDPRTNDILRMYATFGIGILILFKN